MEEAKKREGKKTARILLKTYRSRARTVEARAERGKTRCQGEEREGKKERKLVSFVLPLFVCITSAPYSVLYTPLTFVSFSVAVSMMLL